MEKRGINQINHSLLVYIQNLFTLNFYSKEFFQQNLK